MGNAHARANALCVGGRALRWGSLAKRKIGDFGLVDVPALIKSRVIHGVKNFVHRRDKQQ